MRNLILAGAAALAFTAVPAVGQDVAVDSNGNVYVLTDSQQGMYDGWPAERQSAYDAWPYGVQEYYWTLTPAQIDGWWVLNDEQRVRIYEMTPDARAQAWTQIAAQLNANTPAASASTTAMASTSAAAMASTQSPRFVSREVTQTTPAGYQAPTAGADLPVCTPNQQDGCINSWEKNKTGNRPLEYWPGRPASEIKGKLPAEQPDN
ncbi:hypothetical protein K3172_11055 [Qipengyuania sp. 6B39]|uniref:hypothetical protein n=1 Tax=Qipengyuania proteolytica TaxID=2867239 RepID=UPI001C890C6B|nr:hypothetical protein [Qipengyuania proteolytica]MBX7496392.1 hypothetical protein [Qipengyuania proteolytica]